VPHDRRASNATELLALRREQVTVRSSLPVTTRTTTDPLAAWRNPGNGDAAESGSIAAEEDEDLLADLHHMVAWPGFSAHASACLTA
jgi:hypothetical protein